MQRTLSTLAITLVLCLVSSVVYGQFDTASVVGTVRDNTAAVVPGATVTLSNLDTGITATRVSDENGSFEFMNVRIGRYKATAELQGFSIALADNIQVAVGARQRVDLQLKTGNLTETVEVVGAATRLETDSSQRGQVITSEQAVQLPLNGREYSALALLSPGVRLSSLNTGSASTVREGSFNINGLRSTFNNFLLDGLDNNAYGTSNQGFSNQVMQPSPDAVAEFKVVTNNMSAEYGRSAGGTINVAYRSGTNRWSGAAWEFFRDTKLNAVGFFKPVTGEKPPLSRDQFGGTFGGPLIKNRAFFFGDYEGFRQTRKSVGFATIPTVLQRQGVLAVAVRNPVTGEAYAAGTPVPMTDFARRVLSALPDPTSSAASNNYSILQEFTNDNDKGNVKADFQISPSMNVFTRVGYRDVDIFDQPITPLPSGGGGNAQTYVTNKQLAAGYTWTRSGSALFEARLGWSRTVAGKNPAALGSTGALEAYGIRGLPTDPRISGGLPNQIVTGLTDFGRQATNPQWQYPEMWNPKVNYTWIAGRHSLKTGYEFQHVSTEVQDVNPLYGRDTYNGQFTRPAGAAAGNIYNLSDFMFGFRSQYALSNILIANVRQEMHFLYVQDDFRVNSRLTLNAGLRYEVRHTELGAGQYPVEFRSRDTHHGARGGWLDQGSVTHQAGSQQLRAPARVRLVADPIHRRTWGLRRQLHPFPPGGCGQPAADQRSAGGQRRRQPDQSGGPVIPHDPAGLSRSVRRPVEVQSARRQHHVHARRLPLEPGPELLHLGTARDCPEHDRRRGVCRESRR